MSNIKTEPGIKLEPGAAPQVKPEPGASPAAIKHDPDLYEDDELYEDPGDLDISNGGRAVWLVKLPSFVAERWNEIDDDEEITLGYVKVNNSNSDENGSRNLKLTLERNAINGEEIPLEYDLTITNMEVTNTFVFTEKDLPGYENKTNTGVKDGATPMPARFLQQQQPKESTPGADRNDPKNKNNRFTPYIRKAIPKKTAIVGTARHECTLQPVHNDAYTAFQRTRVSLENAPKHSTKLLANNIVSGNLLNPGTTGLTNTSLSNFVRPTVEKRKATDLKAARIPQNELFSALFDAFQVHEYWTMKGFREHLQQPEGYLKSTLEQIAVMHRSGPFNGKWSMKPEFKGMAAKKKMMEEAEKNQEAVGPGGGSAAGGGASSGGGGAGEPIEIDDDEEEVEMEDVPM